MIKLKLESNFNITNGYKPYNSPAISQDGTTAYIATWEGGQYNTGSLIAVNLSNGSQSLITSFTPSMGVATFASPTLSEDESYIYLVMGAGGANQVGTLNKIINPLK